jgi:hypothetical protein
MGLVGKKARDSGKEGAKSPSWQHWGKYSGENRPRAIEENVKQEPEPRRTDWRGE